MYEYLFKLVDQILSGASGARSMDTLSITVHPTLSVAVVVRVVMATPLAEMFLTL